MNVGFRTQQANPRGLIYSLDVMLRGNDGVAERNDSRLGAEKDEWLLDTKQRNDGVAFFRLLPLRGEHGHRWLQPTAIRRGRARPMPQLRGQLEPGSRIPPVSGDPG